MKNNDLQSIHAPPNVPKRPVPTAPDGWHAQAAGAGMSSPQNRPLPASRHPASPRPRSAFTLIELIVSVGLLALMITLAGRVFSLSVSSTSQATALIEVSQSFRLLEATLRGDLVGINPQRSMLVIAAAEINAYWTVEGRELDQIGATQNADGDPSTGYLHDGDPEREEVNGNLVLPRADVLMTFTSRKATSVRYPEIWSNITQVVYGHAELGELAANGTWRVSPAPYPTDGTVFGTGILELPDRFIAQNWHLARRSVVVVDAAESALESLLGIEIDPSPPTSPDSDEFGEGTVDLLVNTFVYQAEVVERAPSGAPPIPARWYSRSQMDLTPPAQLADRIGHYFLPKCASFKIEWTISGKFEIGGTTIRWHDPAKASLPPTDLEHDDYVDTGDPTIDVQLMQRFGYQADPLVDPFVIGAGSPIWFATDPITGSGEDPFWPTALRITVDLYDDTGRLRRPTRHVLILPIGQS